MSHSTVMQYDNTGGIAISHHILMQYAFQPIRSGATVLFARKKNIASDKAVTEANKTG